MQQKIRCSYISSYVYACTLLIATASWIPSLADTFPRNTAFIVAAMVLIVAALVLIVTGVVVNILVFKYQKVKEAKRYVHTYACFLSA